MVTGDKLRAVVGQALSGVGMHMEADKVGAVFPACFKIVQIITDIDNAIRRQCQIRDDPRKDFVLVATLVGCAGIGAQIVP